MSVSRALRWLARCGPAQFAAALALLAALQRARGPRAVATVALLCALNELTRSRRLRRPAEPRPRGPYAALYDSLSAELSGRALPVRGQLPAWLSGTLVRNGPALWDFGNERAQHWFDGQAMLHSFSFSGEEGAVRYSNRLLDTANLRAHREQGKIAVSEFGSDPCATVFGRLASLFLVKPSQPYENANVNVVRMAGRFFALTEVPLPIEFDPATLDTLGRGRFVDDLRGHISSAHAVESPDGLTTSQHVEFGPQARYVVYTVPTLGPGPLERTVLASIPTDRPSYMHSFGLSRRFVVLVEFPYVFRVREALKFAVDNVLWGEQRALGMFRWAPELGTQFTVVSRETGEVVARRQAPAFFAYHHVNAFETPDGDLAVDMMCYDEVRYDDLTLARLQSADDNPLVAQSGQLRRYTVGLGGSDAGGVESTVLFDGVLELPRFNEERRGAAYRFAYGVDMQAYALRKVDLETGELREWREEQCAPGEPVFVPSPSSPSSSSSGEEDGEDQGVVLSVIFDARTRASFLLVLDAASFSEVARAVVPHGIPAGLHGAYYS